MRAHAFALIAACTSPVETGRVRDAILADTLRPDLEKLASDDFLGRGTGEPGGALAEAYVADAFVAAGLVPLRADAELRLPFELHRKRWSERSTIRATTALGETVGRIGVDFRPFSFSDGGDFDAEVVFAGYGITAPELGWDDYAGLDARGKVVVVLRHDPGEGDPTSAWKDHGGHALFRSKTENAQAHGAFGLVVVTDPLRHTTADDLRDEGRFSLEPPPREGSSGVVREYPHMFAIHASRAFGDALVAPLGSDLATLQRRVDAGERAQAEVPGTKLAFAIAARQEHQTLEAHNVVGVLPGSDETLADQLVVVGAHFDHLGSFAGVGDTVYNGADDNASGTAALLALARSFASLPAAARPKRTLVFAAFGAEESGLLGSTALLADDLDPERVVFMLNLDMIGRSQGRLEVVGDGFGTGLTELVHVANGGATGPALDLTLKGADYAGNSDHHPFMEADVPFLFLHTGLHDDYHQLSDHADKIDVDGAARIARLAFGVLAPIAAGEVTPGFIHHVGWLGVSVEPETRTTGVRAVITRVDEGSRAAEAGFLVGDAIYGFNDEKMEDPSAVGALFRGLTPGESARITVDRANSRVTLSVERARTGYLGVWPADLTEEFRARHGLPGDTGLLLREVMAEGPAAAAGLKDGDAVIAIGGVPTTLNTLSKTLTRIGAGEIVPITVIRDGQRLELTMTLGERPERP